MFINKLILFRGKPFTNGNAPLRGRIRHEYTNINTASGGESITQSTLYIP